MRRRVIRALRELDAVAVENSVGPGTPDVNYIGGWVELKEVERWPVRGGPLRVPHFKPEQRAWIRRRWKRGGDVWVLLKVESDWLLLDGLYASACLGDVPAASLSASALRHWSKGLVDAELLQELRIGRNRPWLGTSSELT